MRKLSIGIAAGAAMGLSSLASAQSLDMQYDVVDIGGGLFEYSFVVETDAGWAPGMGWRWMIFGDQQSAPSPMTNVQMTSAVPAPWTTLTSSGGFHNGPTFAPVLDYWIPASGTETLEWSATSDVLLHPGELLFSTIAGTVGGAVAPEFRVGEFTSGCPCDCNFDTSTGANVCDIFDFLAFQNGFVSGDPCSCDRNTSTGAGTCDIFDFLDFQNGFVAGCP